ncbi:uncharacterized protein LOC132389310 [Hypanus sabinus]|uniref:uncharacterized protein LOC132389310 n=1 Tax=Hypanus sabinus TaxID=79690 RepID=UPI0028C40C7A|nr:uncharacterized protein LOC132389310 [Hypanus sabinus]
MALLTIRHVAIVFYPIVAAFGVPANLLTMVVLFRGKCGLSKALFNCVTVRRILLASKVRRGLRGHSSQTQKDPEMESRRKSIILLFSVSGSFILLWLPVTVSFLTTQLTGTAHYDGDYTDSAYVANEAGYMLMYLSSCTNTCIYTATQAKFREEMRRVLTSPWTLFSILIKRHSCVDTQGSSGRRSLKLGLQLINMKLEFLEQQTLAANVVAVFLNEFYRFPHLAAVTHHLLHASN